MTALDAYDRLEAAGTLKRSGNDKSREVVVTFGEATLTMNALSETGDTPITHWSLAAIDLISESEGAAIYSLNAMTEETLEIEDQTFRQALAQVLQDRKGQTYGAKRSKAPMILLIAALVIGIGYVALPKIVESIAKGMISPERAQIIANEMLPMIEDRTGPACETPLAAVALERLAQRLNPDGNTTLAIHDLGDANIISLPGGKVLISQSTLENANSNDAIAGWAALGIAGVIETPAIAELFSGQGILDGLKFLSSGQSARTKPRRTNPTVIRS